jgi:hypothetical protein
MTRSRSSRKSVECQRTEYGVTAQAEYDNLHHASMAGKGPVRVSRPAPSAVGKTLFAIKVGKTRERWPCIS